MATICHFPSFPSHKLFLSDDRHNRRELKLGCYTVRQQNPPHKRIRFRASSIKKSRKVKSNAELCDDIREFVAAIGLPEGHLPTMKEFSQHGRIDLAYIVRRRGYKRIGELLESTKESDLDGSNVEKGVSEDKDEEPKVVVGDFPMSIEVSIMGHSSFSSVIDTEVKSDDDNCVLVEASADLSVRETASYDLEGHNENGFINRGEGSFSETKVSIMEYGSLSSEDSAFVFGNHKESPLETSTNVSLGEGVLGGGDEMVNIAMESDEDLLVEGETEDKSLNGGDEMVNITIESVDDLLIEGETGDKGLSLGDEAVNIAIESDDDLLVEGETEDKGLNGGDETVNIAIESADDVLVVGETGDKGLNIGDETVNIAIESDDNLLAGGENRDRGLNVGVETVNVAIESADDLLVEGEAGDKGLNGGNETVKIAVESADDLVVVRERATLQDWQSEDYNKSKEDTSSAEVLITENNSGSFHVDLGLSSDDSSSVPVELSALSLDERVANFVQYGHLDTVEESQFLTNTSEHSEKAFDGGNGAITSNESAEESLQLFPATIGNRPFRDDDLSAEGQSTQFDKNLDIKTSKRDNQVEISHLKFMLHRKELELSRLKEQIEKEKHDLSVLQAKAESEISKAQKLTLEKDAELYAAEETLSGLVEVYIQYHGEGEIVEVAGSFNGWHHWIKMDPQPSPSITDSVGARKYKLWSTVLWLYPGVYEIKFIVDGEWKIDPQRESVTHGNICNNILRVHR